ncbi:MAG TPA: MFS transporter, partial [Nitrososphaera sp.]|nr:MFS transporter [Nitrososphaera sp.]
MSYSVFVDIFLYGVTVPVMPFAIQQRIGVPTGHVQYWVSTMLSVYGAALLIGSVMMGWTIDKLSNRKWLFLLGIAVLGGSTLMLMLAKSTEVMLIARVLQGASSAETWVLSTVLLNDRLGTQDLGKGLGWVNLTRTIGVVIGPVLGGVIYAQLSYYAVFGVALGFVAIDFVLRILLIETRVARKWDPSIGPPEDGAEKATPKRSENYDKDGRKIILSAGEVEAAAAPLTAVPKRGRVFQFVRRVFPVLPLVSDTRVVVAAWGCFWQAAIISGFDAVVPIFVRQTFHWTSEGAGLIMLAIVIPSLISPVVGHFSDKHGPKWWSVAGYVLNTPPLILLRLVKDDTINQKIAFAVLLALIGGFNSFLEIPLWVEVVARIEEKAQANANSVNYADKTNLGTTGQAHGIIMFCFASGVLVWPTLLGFLHKSIGWENMTYMLG